MPDLPNRPQHEAALAGAIQPVFLALAAQGDRPDWEGAKRQLVSAIEPVLLRIGSDALSGMEIARTTVRDFARTTVRDAPGVAHEQAVLMAAEIITNRKQQWQAAREVAAQIETPEGEDEIDDDLLLLYLLYGIPNRRTVEAQAFADLAAGRRISPFGTPLASPVGLSSRLARLETYELTPAWEEHLAGYVPRQGQGLVTTELGQERVERAAVTETTRANSRAERAAAEDFERQTGVRLIPIWVIEDNSACEICKAKNGLPSEEGPPAHPHCRCFERWILASDWAIGRGRM